MKTQHTPGPWEVDGFDLTSVIKNEGSDTWPQWKHIARCDYGYTQPDKHFESNKANAKLIASAPELLEALKEAYLALYQGNSVDIDDAMRRSSKSDQFEQKLISAIKKATE